MIIEQSKNLGDVIKNDPFLNARLSMARRVLEFDIANELFYRGIFATSDSDIKRIIDGFPEDVLYKELSARM